MDGQDDDNLPPPKVRRNKKTKSKSKENKISLLRTLLMRRYCFIWKWYVWSLTLADLHSVVGRMSWDIRAKGQQELCTRSFLCAAAHRCLRPPFWSAGMHLEALTKWIMVRRTMLILSWLLSTTWWSGAGILRLTQSEHRERIRTFFPKTLHKTIHKGFSLVSQWFLKN